MSSNHIISINYKPTYIWVAEGVLLWAGVAVVAVGLVWFLYQVYLDLWG